MERPHRTKLYPTLIASNILKNIRRIIFKIEKLKILLLRRHNINGRKIF